MAFGRDFYAALGRLVFEASHLEHEVALLHAVAKTSGGVTANGEEEDDLPAVKTPRGVWRELDGGLNKLGSHDDLRESDRTVIDDCKAWVDEAKRLLGERHRRAHAFWLMDLTAVAAGEPGAEAIDVGLDLRTGARLSSDSQELEALADQLCNHRAAAVRVCLRDRLIVAHQRANPRP